MGQDLTFNQDGRLTEEITRNTDASEWRAVNDYSDSSKLLTTKTYNPSGALSREVRYLYDNEGRVVAEQLSTQGGEVIGTGSATYAYDSGGGRIKTQECDFSGMDNVMVCIDGISISGRGVSRVQTRYAAGDLAVDVKAFNAAGLLVNRVEITRDARGNPLEETQYAGDVVAFGPCASGSCSTEQRALRTEEQKAELAAELARLFSPGTTISKHIHRYDVEGRLVESTLTIMGMYADRRTFAYDEAGNKSEEVDYREDGTLESKAIFVRKYDERGNWTEELVSTSSGPNAELGLSTPVHLTRRTITYW